MLCELTPNLQGFRKLARNVMWQVILHVGKTVHLQREKSCFSWIFEHEDELSKQLRHITIPEEPAYT